MRVALCFACNETYMPLCKGLVLSLHDRTPRGFTLDAHFIDVGCEEKSLAWLVTQGVALHSFARNSYVTLPANAALPRYADAQLCRPFLPQLIPGYDVYIWMDTDIWIQGADALTSPVQAVAAFPTKMLICPEYHYGYIRHRNLRYAILAHQQWYFALYGDADLAEELSTRPMYNSGFFVMQADHPLWQKWAKGLELAYARGQEAAEALHYAEQLALNRLLHEGEHHLPLDPLYNYAAGGSATLVDKAGKVLVGYPPHSQVKNVHLLAFPLYGAMYLDKGLLYQQGAYLTAPEREALRQLSCGKQ